MTARRPDHAQLFMNASKSKQARKIILSGIVQGVGFRPFIYRHAHAHKLHGWTRNSSGRVEVHIQGDLRNLDEFTSTLLGCAPDLSRPVLESICETSCSDTGVFLILPSQADSDADIHLPADLFTCDDCLRELNDPGNRRYRYPFINCTQCGPRYTLIEALPYDRPNTSMSGFPLCGDCHAEYTNPLDRRYHAEPVACAKCGPELTYSETGKVKQAGNESALSAALAALSAGKVLAIKGIGGYHLVCDACNDDAVDQLRRTKPRPHKPLAVMFPATPGDELATLRQYLLADDVETELLKSPARPIVLVQKQPVSKLSDGIAPGLNEVGAMLPYSPLHHTLLNDFGAPLVASSANISGEPVLTENEDIEQRLAHVANAFLHHDRPIVRPADDPVYRVINSRPAPIRQGRGIAPVELDLPFRLDKTVLAVGTQMKNSIALAWGERVVVSPHIGEMDSLRSLQTFEQCISDLQALYQVKAEHIVCDAHPGYTSTRWAQRQSLPVSDVYHHHAHASAVYAEAMLNNSALDDMLVFAWDGVGLGPDGTLWGGEALAGKPRRWRRVATFRPFKLPGGERAGREPWRSAAALCWESGQDCPLDEASDPLLFSFWQQGKNAPFTTAAGRLFDAASALCGVCTLASFEGQGPMQLEALAAKHGNFETCRPTALGISKIDDVYSVDWASLIPMLMNESDPVTERAAHFHLSMADSLLQQAKLIRVDTAINRVGLAGGVFQNRVLTEKCIELLNKNGFEVTLPLTMPVNDAAISFGQIVEYGYNRR
ncbi:MAG: carbamoyltransferase HypF [Lysobacterales bacterium]